MTRSRPRCRQMNQNLGTGPELSLFQKAQPELKSDWPLGTVWCGHSCWTSNSACVFSSVRGLSLAHGTVDSDHEREELAHGEVFSINGRGIGTLVYRSPQSQSAAKVIPPEETGCF